MSLREFKVFGDPVPQGRGRIIKRGPHYGIADPEKSRVYKEQLWIVGQKHRIDPLPTGPLFLELVFEIKRPKSAKKGSKWRDKKPDLDNLCKGVMDAFKGVLWHDDGQIAYLTCGKVHSDSPGVTVKVGRLE